MTFQETVHFPVDGLLAQQEWLSTRAGLDGHQGYVHLGLERRTFLLAMFHELHCMNTIRAAILDHDNARAGHHHVQHCLNYMRQLFLCAADATLEPHDFLDWDYERDRVGVTRQCRDWSAVYDGLGASWKAWHADMETEGSQSTSSHPQHAAVLTAFHADPTVERV